MKAAPIRLGVLYDFPQRDSGSSFEEALTLGLGEAVESGRLDRGFELVRQATSGLPAGSARDVEDGFGTLDDAGVLCIVGPSISDNGLVVRDLADAAGVPCVNYTGGELTRGAHMFHYQVGSLEEEPAVLARLLGDRGFSRVALAHDNSPVGNGYATWFDRACATSGLEVSTRVALSPLAEEAGDVVERMSSVPVDAAIYLGLGVAARSLAIAIEEAGWKVPVVANSALMFGYVQPSWRAAWDGWAYVDTISDGNASRAALRERSPASAAGPVGVAAYDIGRLIGEGFARCDHLTREGIREGLERVKRLPASSGSEGTTMGFGCYDHAALKGEFLVLRCWSGGQSVEHRPD